MRGTHASPLILFPPPTTSSCTVTISLSQAMLCGPEVNNLYLLLVLFWGSCFGEVESISVVRILWYLGWGGP